MTVYQSRKRQALLLMAIMQFAFAASMVVRPQNVPPDSLYPFDLVPLGVRATMWLILAVIAAGVAFTDLYPIGWVLLMAMPIIRISAYLWSAAMVAIPGDPTGELASLPLAVFWAAWAGMVWVLAGWPDFASQIYLTADPGSEAKGGTEGEPC